MTAKTKSLSIMDEWGRKIRSIAPVTDTLLSISDTVYQPIGIVRVGENTARGNLKSSC